MSIKFSAYSNGYKEEGTEYDYIGWGESAIGEAMLQGFSINFKDDDFRFPGMVTGVYDSKVYTDEPGKEKTNWNLKYTYKCQWKTVESSTPSVEIGSQIIGIAIDN